MGARMQLSLGKESVVVRGMRPEEYLWGPYQFPRPYRVGDRIIVSVHVEEDDIYNAGKTARWFESVDGGVCWEEISPSVAAECGLKLPNGDKIYFPVESGLVLAGYTVTPVGMQTPDYDFSERAAEKTLPVQDGMTFFHDGSIIKAYDADRLPKSISKKEWHILRTISGNGNVVRENVKVEWPYLTRVVIFHPGESVGTLKSIQPRGTPKLGPDGAVWVSAFSGEGHLNPYNGQYSPYYSAEIFRSDDGGKTFRLRGHMEYEADGKKYPYQSGGFSDSDFEFMPDGSIVWFLRSTWAAYTGKEWGPMYYSRSTDSGYTWTKPKVFSEVGILPRLCTLKCGVTLLCYARPGLYVTACNDGCGLKWSKALVVMKAENRSGLANRPTEHPVWHEWDGACGNPEIIPLDDNSALLFYGDFYYPDAEGVRRKTILCRKIIVSDC